MSEDVIYGVCDECDHSSPTVPLRIEDREVVCERCEAVVDTIASTRSERAEKRRERLRSQRMTVKELIQRLQALDQDLPVQVVCSGAFANVGHVEEATVEWNTGEEETIVRIVEDGQSVIGREV